MDEKGQVSFEYLLTVLFGIVLAFAAFLLAQYVFVLSGIAQVKVSNASTDAISTMMG